MHSEERKDSPGLCSSCGMKLVLQEIKKEDKHEGHGHKKHGNIFKTKFWVSLVLSVPVVMYSEIVNTLFGYTAPSFPGSSFLPLILSSIIFFYGGWIFISSAWRELKGRSPGMMTLISLAIFTAYIYSLSVVITGKGDVLFWELATLITIMLLGHWMEMRAVKGAQGALKELSKLLPDEAEIIENGNNKIIPLSELKKDDVVFIRPGGKIPADAVIVEGSSDINESMVTGESRPVNKEQGDEVIAGTVNGNGSLKARVSKIGEDTFLSGVMRLVEEAQNSKSKLQLLSDKAAYYLTIIAISGGVITFAGWTLFSDAGFPFAISRLVAVLVITCPHALGLAIPLVASISTTMAAQNGFLVKRRLALEAARNIDTVLFDKTGTLTSGEYGVSNVWPAENKSKEDVLSMAAAIDAHSEHFIAKAIVKKTKEENINFHEAIKFSRIPGRGVKGEIEGKEIFVGSKSLAEEFNINIPRDLEGEVESDSKKGKTIIYVLDSNNLIGILSLSDTIRPESKDALQKLKEEGVEIAMITGDSAEVAKWVAEELNIDKYFAGVLPGQKADKVRVLQSEGRKVAMVGDGINDAPALTQADLGIAIGAGTNVAIESAGIILVKDDPRDIVRIIKLSKLTYKKMIQNLFWAAGYNVIALPLAAGVLAFKGIILQPAIAAILMSVSTVIVAVNAILLKKEEL
ncbi:MAG: copper-translocating P-type ATPase [Candidatus Yanofskybacteria bacterium CG10_big_fil_rev_8_21_14_0_10_36_16]|uniref:Copper-translocating P-type ATPase n=1 Tax=Candidatus Yanofskybacteria bacterium CG10_big_fil_rev_8_21_14_0_10_36_16 TaxID=1975096 RepID=A0A2J0Q9Y0_9BACT|nr:MAG: copper-translocating P-type ATPase [Candidatus Yanofskybacteria bacterium CG10_big_fil_rev_8_21_14_0_10_36_16]